MEITQATVLKYCDVFPAALGLFPTELPTNLHFRSFTAIQVGAFKSSLDESWCPLCGRVSPCLEKYWRENEDTFLILSSVYE